MGLRLFFLPNLSGATFIQGATFIPDSRVAQISHKLMQFSLHKWRNSFTHVFLVTNYLSAMDLTPVDYCLT